MKQIKRTLLFAIIFVGSKCIAQDNSKNYYKQFTQSFVSTVDYPVDMIRNCIPTVCLVKIQTDSSRNVLDMQLSDSADSLLNVEFKHSKQKLNVILIKKYLKAEYGKADCNTYIIPLSYSLHQMPCPAMSINITTLYKYSKFDGKFLNGNVIFLDPIYSEIAVQR